MGRRRNDVPCNTCLREPRQPRLRFFKVAQFVGLTTSSGYETQGKFQEMACRPAGLRNFKAQISGFRIWRAQSQAVTFSTTATLSMIWPANVVKSRVVLIGSMTK